MTVIINEMIEQNGEALAKAKRTSDFLITITKQILISGAVIVDSLRRLFMFVAHAIKGTMEVLKSLPRGVQELGVVGFMLGGKSKLLVLFLGSTFDSLRSMLGSLSSAYGSMIEAKLNL